MMGSVGNTTTTHPDVGKQVTIKTGWLKGQWGIVRLVEGNTYYVSPYGGNESLEYEKEDLRFK